MNGLKVTLHPEQTFSASVGDNVVHGLCKMESWEGMEKYGHPSGGFLILNDGVVVKGSPNLLHDLSLTTVSNGYVSVPARTLPCGKHVPAFYVAQYACSKGDDGKMVIDATRKPWANINFADSNAACIAAGSSMITEYQWLSIALDIVEQDINWSGGKVGEGSIYQGLHLGTVSSAQPGSYESPKSDERRWHQLSNGCRIYDIAGNVWQWVFDDVQGDKSGIVEKNVHVDSPSLTTAPYGSKENGIGYRPDGARDWSGAALLRGGRWDDGDYAGVFRLSYSHPSHVSVIVGFRSTLPHSGL